MANIDIDEWLERIGGFLSGAFGPRFAIGMLIGLLDDVTPFQCYEYIRDKKDLLPDITEEDWEKARDFIRKSHIQEIDIGQIRRQFKRRHPDLMQVIVNHPDGEAWLDNQVAHLMDKLGFS